MATPAPLGREREWAALTRFVEDPDARPLLGLTLGRRRVGKTYLLRRLVEAKGGFYHVFPAATPAARMLAQLGASVSRYRGLAVPLSYPDWSAAISDLLAIAGDSPQLVVLDEISYALDQSPELGSLIQHAFDYARDVAPTGSPTRMVLCGSALSTMEKLTKSAGPLFGRVSLTLRVHPFDPPTMARLWGLEEDPHRALLTWVTLGGTPAYRTLLKVAPPEPDEPPADWLLREILAPERAIYTEARESLRFAGQRNPTGYAEVLRALCRGARRLKDIANEVGASSQNVQYRLQTLAQLRLVEQVPDAFVKKRSTWILSEPLLRTWFAVIEPSTPDIDAMMPVDRDRLDQRFRSLVLGPGFEALCRRWVRSATARPHWPVAVERVARSEAGDAEIDVVGLGHALSGKASVVMIGEAKARQRTTGETVLDKLVAQRRALPRQFDTAHTRLAVFSMSGFTPGLRARANAGEAVLVDPGALFGR